MYDDVIINPSALKRAGIDENDIRCAYRNIINCFENGLRMCLGWDGKGRILEIGIDTSKHEIEIVHAMPARKFYLRRSGL